jgi:hypothetical protein
MTPGVLILKGTMLNKTKREIRFVNSEKIIVFFVFFLQLAGISGCGKRSQKVQPKSSTSTGESSTDNDKDLPTVAVKDPTCVSKEKCPPVSFTLAGETGSSAKIIRVGETAAWKFSVKSTAVPGRLLIAYRQIPVWAKSERGEAPGSIIVNGVADQSVAKGQLIFLIRDMTRCLISEKDSKVCASVEKDLSYDKLETVDYSVNKT